MSSLIRVETDGALSLAGKVLPAQITSLSIRGKMVIDKAQPEGASGKKKVFSGYDDSDISIGLLLLERQESGRDRYENLALIHSSFKKLENETPVVYAVQGEFFKAFNIRHVLFQEISADESNTDDSISVSLKFEEHDPVISIVQEQQKNTHAEIETEEEPAVPEGVSEEEYFKFKKLEALSG